MAFSLANASSSLPGMNAPVNVAQTLDEISTEVQCSYSSISLPIANGFTINAQQQLGFLSLNGESRVRILSSQWPADSLPRPTSSLFSISSAKGLLAAASPDAVVIATTESVRQAFSTGSESEKIKPFTPQLTLEAPRLSQVCFTTNGNYLILSAESGGGLAVYETQSLLQGNKQPAFQISTENVGVRAIVPNPAAENADIVAIILERGELMVAHLGQRQIVAGQNGPVLKDSVSCASWSVKGKQLIAGLADGTAYQLEPNGSGKASIPRPPGIEDGWHTSSILWLANDDFLLVHTPTNSSEPVDSVFHLVRTNKDRSSFQFSKLPVDPAPPFGLNRLPLTHYFSRLRGWGHLLDTLIVSSVASADVGLITKSDVPLASDIDANLITNTYTNTSFVSDSRRAQLPTSISDGMGETSPIGMALDLSATEKAYKPIPADEIDYSPVPLPAMMLLNHEGILSAWWVVYNQAVRESMIYPSMIYPGMVADGGSVSSTPSLASPSTQTSGFSALSAPKLQAPAFGSSGFSKPAAAAAFGQSGFGAQRAQTSTFGGSAFSNQFQLGAKSSTWSSGNTSQTGGAAFGQSTFGEPASLGKPAFGSTTAFGTSGASGFGSAGSLGQNKSPWGTIQSQPESDGSAKTTSPFGGAATTASSGFGKLASGGQSGFAALGGSTSSQFGQSKPAFAATSTPGTSFGISGMSTPQPSFGSTVTIDSKTDGSTIGSKSIFGSTPVQQSSVFGKQTAPPADQDDDAMADDGDEAPAQEPQKPASGLFGTGDSAFKLGSTFTADTSSKEEPAQKETGKSLFGSDFAAALANKQDEGKSEPKKPEEPAANKSYFDQLPKKDEPATTTTPPKAAPFTFPSRAQETPPKGTALQAPVPPEVISKPASSPAPTASATASVEELPSVRSSPPDAEHVPAPQSDEEVSGEFEDESGEVSDSQGEEEETDEVEEVVDDAPLPPDPTKVKKPDWFHEAIPGAAPTKPLPLLAKPQRPSPLSSVLSRQPPPEAPSPPPATESPVFSGKTTTPAGFPKAPVTFQPPSTIRESPRSPSPQRSASTPVGRAMGPPPTPPSQLRQAPAPRPMARPSLPPQQEEASITASDLVDENDARIRATLDAPLEAKTKLEPFVAHHESSVQPDAKTGLAAAIDRVFRDINSMLDNLGLNARSVEEFIKGHSEFGKDAGREREDLGNGDDWVLVEIEDLGSVERVLERDVEGARVEGVAGMVGELVGMGKELRRWRREMVRIRETLRALGDPRERKRAREAPLSGDMKAEQAKVRGAFAEYQKRLAEAEDAVLVARAKIASAKGKMDTKAVPTVEAVENTIKKMTGMVQQRRDDIDVLEMQMRKLGIAREGTPSRPTSSSLRSSVFGRSSAFNTPSPGKGRTFEVPDDEGGDDEEVDPVEVEQKRIWEEKVGEYKEKRARRKVALNGLGDTVHRRAGVVGAATS